MFELIQNYNYTWSDAVGNIGVALLLTTFYLNVSGRISSQGLCYNISNLVVAILLTINLYYKPNLSSFIIEFFWAGISIYGIIQYYKARHLNDK
jgi:hypothetical protein